MLYGQLKLARQAHAETATGVAALKQARSAWDQGAFETAEPFYREALEKGGLAPPEVLEGYVRLGAIRSRRGKKDSAIAAFRAASILDATFTVPSEAGARGSALAEKAKRDTAKVGSIQLGVDVPTDVAAGKSFKITASVDKGHLPLVNRIGVRAKDGTTGKEVSLDAKPAESVEFEIGADLTLPGASILVHVDALDGHLNRLASAEGRVKVPADVPRTSLDRPNETESRQTAPKKTGLRKRSFWSTPWPYVIGGLAIVGAGTAVYFGTRPSPNVSVGTVEVRGADN